MRILFIGGTGTISSACSELALARGIELHLLNRGQTSKRPVPEGARVLVGDIREPGTVLAALGSMTFDVVVDWVAPGSKAQKKGLRPGDRVLAVDGASVLIAAQVRPLLRASAGERRTLRIARGARTLELVIEPEPFTPP